MSRRALERGEYSVLTLPTSPRTRRACGDLRGAVALPSAEAGVSPVGVRQVEGGLGKERTVYYIFFRHGRIRREGGRGIGFKKMYNTQPCIARGRRVGSSWVS